MSPQDIKPDSNVISEKINELVNNMPAWAYVLFFVLLGGGGSGFITRTLNISTNDRVEAQITESVMPLSNAVDNLSKVIARLDTNLQQQAELTSYNQCQIRTLADGGDISDCNLQPDFSMPR